MARGFGPIPSAKPANDLHHVRPDSSLGDPERDADFSIGPAQGDQPKDLQLPRRKRSHGRNIRRWNRRLRGCNHIGGHIPPAARDKTQDGSTIRQAVRQGEDTGSASRQRRPDAARSDMGTYQDQRRVITDLGNQASQRRALTVAVVDRDDTGDVPFSQVLAL